MKKVTPFGNRILVKRRKIGEKAGSIVLPDEVKERQTEIADVVYVPDHTFCDKKLIENAEKIIDSLAKKAEEGDVDAVSSLIDFNEYLRVKTLKPGDVLFIGKYVGTDFEVQETGEKLSIITPDGIYGKVVESK